MATGPGCGSGIPRTSSASRLRNACSDSGFDDGTRSLPDLGGRTGTLCHSGVAKSAADRSSHSWSRTKVKKNPETAPIIAGALEEPQCEKTYSLNRSCDVAEKTYTLTQERGLSTYTLSKMSTLQPPGGQTFSLTSDSSSYVTEETTDTYSVPSAPRQKRVVRRRGDSPARRSTVVTRGPVRHPLLLTRRQLLWYPLAVSAALGTLATLLAVAPFQKVLARREFYHAHQQLPHGGGLLAEANPFAGRRCASAPCRRDGAYLRRHLAPQDASPCDDFERYVCLRWRPRNAAAHSADKDEVLKLEQQVFRWLHNTKPLSPLLGKCMREKQDGDRALRDFLLPAASLGDFPYSGSRAGSVALWRAAGRVLLYSGTSALLSVHAKADGSPALGLPDTLGEGDLDRAEITYRALARAAPELSSAKAEGTVRFALQVERAAYYGAGAGPVKVVASQLGELWAFLSQVRKGLPSAATVTVISPSYVRRLRDVVRRTPPDAVLNFLALRVHFQAAPLTPPGPLLEAYSRITGRHERWRQCLGVALSFAPTLVLEAARSVTGAHFLTEQAAELADAVRRQVLDLMDKTPPLSEDREHKQALRKARLQVYGPPWTQNPEAATHFAESVPQVKVGQTALRSWAAIAEYELESRVSRESWPAQWVLERTCVLDAASGRLALPPLLLNESTPGGVVGALQFARAGARLATCLLRSLLSLEPTALPALSPAAANHIRSARSCLDGQKLSDARETLPLWAGLRPALQLFKRHGGDGLTLEGLPHLGGAQLFFVYWALELCSGVPRGATKFTINAAVANEPAFHEAFLCTPTSPMNPLPHCDLWGGGHLL
ncbi:hypothetical protein HPB48_010744 [Haemaphysalis longicornis]|uniref:Uncharacterized protein n=1 Tax=Haemaphysalis longicornis TaxID=44386 RepID=A0A9J6GAL2_HAELO|nr:hypothetical protein HPB48_010744 [Haemaphysalis longicornis]